MEENRDLKKVTSESSESERKSCAFFGKIAATLKIIGSWFSRMFMGASKSLARDSEKKKHDDDDHDKKEKDKRFEVEEIVSPGKQAIVSFFRRPLAVVALCVVVGMFLFVFIGPLFMPTYSDSYTSTTQVNLRPTMSMRSVPSGLKNDVKEISSNSFFSVGLSNSGKVYVWGITKLSVSKIDLGDIPEEVKNSKITHVAAGTDHIVAVSEDGKVYAWGNNNLGQYVKDEKDLQEQSKNDGIVIMPEQLRNGTIDAGQIKKVTCGTQASAILMKDGTLYIWGNSKTYSNMAKFKDKKFYDIAFTLTSVVGVSEDKKSVYTGVIGLFDKLKFTMEGGAAAQNLVIGSKTIESLAVTNSSICLVLNDGSTVFGGSIMSDHIVNKPNIGKKDKIVKISGGVGHFIAMTESGKVYAWGDNTHGQCDISAENASDCFAGAYQSYVFDKDGKLDKSAGLKGYVFGTDGNGADVFKRIISGGRMTLTIGAVAVIISTIIGIIVGCISGYFGGWIDMLLMRLTEIVAAIPFLPFAMILSALMSQTTIDEKSRIFLIMVILGVLSWTGLARLVRGQVLSARENEYVTAAKAMGVKETKIAFRHILPNVISIIIVTLTLDFAGCMLTESSLSFLGFGVQYPRPTWGNMLNATRTLTIIGNFWWLWIFPGLFLAITTICINIVGDTLRDVLDPKSSSER